MSANLDVIRSMKVQELHQKAMQYCQNSLRLQDKQKIIELKQALDLEKEAAQYSETQAQWSMCYHNAASLALQIKDYTQTQNLLKEAYTKGIDTAYEKEMQNLNAQLQVCLSNQKWQSRPWYVRLMTAFEHD
jgi:hypothetical protein